MSVRFIIILDLCLLDLLSPYVYICLCLLDLLSQGGGGGTYSRGFRGLRYFNVHGFNG